MTVKNSVLSRNIIPGGNVIIASRVGLGKVCLLAQDTAINQDLKAVIPNVLLEREYLFWWFKSMADFIIANGKGATVHGITLDFLKALAITLPPLDEQRRIVAKLDAAFAKIDALKRNAEQNLQNARDLFQQALSEAMTPKEGVGKVSLYDVCTISSCLVDPRLTEYRSLLHVGGANIESGTGRLLDLRTAEEEKLKSGKFTFDSSMVLYNKIRPYLRKVARPDFSGLCSADMYPLKPLAPVHRDYLYYVLISQAFTEYANMNSARAGMPKLNRESLFAYKFFLPILEKQQMYAERLDLLAKEISSLNTNCLKIIADCEEMKKSVLTRAFNGEL